MRESREMVDHTEVDLIVATKKFEEERFLPDKPFQGFNTDDTDTTSFSGYRRDVSFPPNTQPVSILIVPFSHSGSCTGVWP